MSNNSHLKTAHDYGVKKALEKCGYSDIDSVKKDVDALGLLQEQPKTAASTDDVMAALKAKLS